DQQRFERDAIGRHGARDAADDAVPLALQVRGAFAHTLEGCRGRAVRKKEDDGVGVVASDEIAASRVGDQSLYHIVLSGAWKLDEDETAAVTLQQFPGGVRERFVGERAGLVAQAGGGFNTSANETLNAKRQFAWIDRL